MKKIISVKKVRSILERSNGSKNIEATMTEIENEGHALYTDKWVYRIVVSGLVVIILACLLCTYLLASVNDVPEIFMAIGSAAVGAIAGLLAPRPGSIEEE